MQFWQAFAAHPALFSLCTVAVTAAVAHVLDRLIWAGVRLALGKPRRPVVTQITVAEAVRRMGA